MVLTTCFQLSLVTILPMIGDIFCDENPTTDIWLSGVSLEENLVVENLLKLTPKISMSCFERDSVLIQIVGKEEGKSEYYLDDDDTQPVYYRQANDEGKEVIVLGSQEDRLNSSSQSKLKYVVLRKDPNGADLYFANMVYLNVLTEQHPNINAFNSFSVKDKLIAVEWDEWLNPIAHHQPVWTSCEATLFASCGFNSSISSQPSTIQELTLSQSEETTPAIPMQTNILPYYQDLDLENFALEKSKMSGRFFGFFSSSSSDRTPNVAPRVKGVKIVGEYTDYAYVPQWTIKQQTHSIRVTTTQSLGGTASLNIRIGSKPVQYIIFETGETIRGFMIKVLPDGSMEYIAQDPNKISCCKKFMGALIFLPTQEMPQTKVIPGYMSLQQPHIGPGTSIFTPFVRASFLPDNGCLRIDGFFDKSSSKAPVFIPDDIERVPQDMAPLSGILVIQNEPKGNEKRKILVPRKPQVPPGAGVILDPDTEGLVATWFPDAQEKQIPGRIIQSSYPNQVVFAADDPGEITTYYNPSQGVLKSSPNNKYGLPVVIAGIMMPKIPQTPPGSGLMKPFQLGKFTPDGEEPPIPGFIHEKNLDDVTFFPDNTSALPPGFAPKAGVLKSEKTNLNPYPTELHGTLNPHPAFPSRAKFHEDKELKDRFFPNDGGPEIDGTISFSSRPQCVEFVASNPSMLPYSYPPTPGKLYPKPNNSDSEPLKLPGIMAAKNPQYPLGAGIFFYWPIAKFIPDDGGPSILGSVNGTIGEPLFLADNPFEIPSTMQPVSGSIVPSSSVTFPKMYGILSPTHPQVYPGLAILINLKGNKGHWHPDTTSQPIPGMIISNKYPSSVEFLADNRSLISPLYPPTPGILIPEHVNSTALPHHIPGIMVPKNPQYPPGTGIIKPFKRVKFIPGNERLPAVAGTLNSNDLQDIQFFPDDPKVTPKSGHLSGTILPEMTLQDPNPEGLKGVLIPDKERDNRAIFKPDTGPRDRFVPNDGSEPFEGEADLTGDLDHIPFVADDSSKFNHFVPAKSGMLYPAAPTKNQPKKIPGILTPNQPPGEFGAGVITPLKKGKFIPNDGAPPIAGYLDDFDPEKPLFIAQDPNKVPPHMNPLPGAFFPSESLTDPFPEPKYGVLSPKDPQFPPGSANFGKLKGEPAAWFPDDGSSPISGGITKNSFPDELEFTAEKTNRILESYPPTTGVLRPNPQNKYRLPLQIPGIMVPKKPQHPPGTGIIRPFEEAQFIPDDGRPAINGFFESKSPQENIFLPDDPKSLPLDCSLITGTLILKKTKKNPNPQPKEGSFKCDPNKPGRGEFTEKEHPQDSFVPNDGGEPIKGEIKPGPATESMIFKAQDPSLISVSFPPRGGILYPSPTDENPSPKRIPGMLKPNSKERPPGTAVFVPYTKGEFVSDNEAPPIKGYVEDPNKEEPLFVADNPEEIPEHMSPTPGTLFPARTRLNPYPEEKYGNLDPLKPQFPTGSAILRRFTGQSAKWTPLTGSLSPIEGMITRNEFPDTVDFTAKTPNRIPPYYTPTPGIITVVPQEGSNLPPKVIGVMVPKRPQRPPGTGVLKPYERAQFIPDEGKGPVPGSFDSTDRQDLVFYPDDPSLLPDTSAPIPGKMYPHRSKQNPDPQPKKGTYTPDPKNPDRGKFIEEEPAEDRFVPNDGSPPIKGLAKMGEDPDKISFRLEDPSMFPVGSAPKLGTLYPSVKDKSTSSKKIPGVLKFSTEGERPFIFPFRRGEFVPQNKETPSILGYIDETNSEEPTFISDDPNKVPSHMQPTPGTLFPTRTRSDPYPKEIFGILTPKSPQMPPGSAILKQPMGTNAEWIPDDGSRRIKGQVTKNDFPGHLEFTADEETQIPPFYSPTTGLLKVTGSNDPLLPFDIRGVMSPKKPHIPPGTGVIWPFKRGKFIPDGEGAFIPGWIDGRDPLDTLFIPDDISTIDSGKPMTGILIPDATKEEPNPKGEKKTLQIDPENPDGFIATQEKGPIDEFIPNDGDKSFKGKARIRGDQDNIDFESSDLPEDFSPVEGVLYTSATDDDPKPSRIPGILKSTRAPGLAVIHPDVKGEFFPEDGSQPMQGYVSFQDEEEPTFIAEDPKAIPLHMPPVPGTLLPSRTRSNPFPKSKYGILTPKSPQIPLGSATLQQPKGEKAAWVPDDSSPLIPGKVTINNYPKELEFVADDPHNIPPYYTPSSGVLKLNDNPDIPSQIPGVMIAKKPQSPSGAGIMEPNSRGSFLPLDGSSISGFIDDKDPMDISFMPDNPLIFLTGFVSKKGQLVPDITIQNPFPQVLDGKLSLDPTHPGRAKFTVKSGPIDKFVPHDGSEAIEGISKIGKDPEKLDFIPDDMTALPTGSFSKSGVLYPSPTAANSKPKRLLGILIITPGKEPMGTFVLSRKAEFIPDDGTPLIKGFIEDDPNEEGPLFVAEDPKRVPPHMRPTPGSIYPVRTRSNPYPEEKYGSLVPRNPQVPPGSAVLTIPSGEPATWIPDSKSRSIEGKITKNNYPEVIEFTADNPDHLPPYYIPTEGILKLNSEQTSGVPAEVPGIIVSKTPQRPRGSGIMKPHRRGKFIPKDEGAVITGFMQPGPSGIEFIPDDPNALHHSRPRFGTLFPESTSSDPHPIPKNGTLSPDESHSGRGRFQEKKGPLDQFVPYDGSEPIEGKASTGVDPDKIEFEVIKSPNFEGALSIPGILNPSPTKSNPNPKSVPGAIQPLPTKTGSVVFIPNKKGEFVPDDGSSPFKGYIDETNPKEPMFIAEDSKRIPPHMGPVSGTLFPATTRLDPYPQDYYGILEPESPQNPPGSAILRQPRGEPVTWEPNDGGTLIPGKIINSRYPQEIEFTADNVNLLPPYYIPVAGVMKLNLNNKDGLPPLIPGILAPKKPQRPAGSALLVPERRGQFIPDNGEPFIPGFIDDNDVQNIKFIPDNPASLPPGFSTLLGKLVPDQSETSKNPEEKGGKIIFDPDHPGKLKFEEMSGPSDKFVPNDGPDHIEGNLIEVKSPAEVMVFVPNDPSKITKGSIHGVMYPSPSPENPNPNRIPGILKPVKGSVHFEPYNRGEFVPDDGSAPIIGYIDDIHTDEPTLIAEDRARITGNMPPTPGTLSSTRTRHNPYPKSIYGILEPKTPQVPSGSAVLKKPSGTPATWNPDDASFTIVGKITKNNFPNEIEFTANDPSQIPSTSAPAFGILIPDSLLDSYIPEKIPGILVAKKPQKPPGSSLIKPSDSGQFIPDGGSPPIRGFIDDRNPNDLTFIPLSGSGLSSNFSPKRGMIIRNPTKANPFPEPKQGTLKPSLKHPGRFKFEENMGPSDRFVPNDGYDPIEGTMQLGTDSEEMEFIPNNLSEIPNIPSIPGILYPHPTPKNSKPEGIPGTFIPKENAFRPFRKGKFAPDDGSRVIQGFIDDPTKDIPLFIPSDPTRIPPHMVPLTGTLSLDRTRADPYPVVRDAVLVPKVPQIPHGAAYIKPPTGEAATWMPLSGGKEVVGKITNRNNFPEEIEFVADEPKNIPPYYSPTNGVLMLSPNSVSKLPMQLPGTLQPKRPQKPYGSAILRLPPGGKFVPDDGQPPIRGFFDSQNPNRPTFIPENFDSIAPDSGSISGTFIPDPNNRGTGAQPEKWTITPDPNNPFLLRVEKKSEEEGNDLENSIRGTWIPYMGNVRIDGKIVDNNFPSEMGFVADNPRLVIPFMPPSKGSFIPSVSDSNLPPKIPGTLFPNAPLQPKGWAKIIPAPRGKFITENGGPSIMGFLVEVPGIGSTFCPDNEDGFQTVSGPIIGEFIPDPTEENPDPISKRMKLVPNPSNPGQPKVVDDDITLSKGMLKGIWKPQVGAPSIPGKIIPDKFPDEVEFLPDDLRLIQPDFPLTKGSIVLDNSNIIAGLPPVIHGIMGPKIPQVPQGSAIMKPFERGHFTPNDGSLPVPGFFDRENPSGVLFIPDDPHSIPTGSSLIPGKWLPDKTTGNPNPEELQWTLKPDINNPGLFRVDHDSSDVTFEGTWVPFNGRNSILGTASMKDFPDKIEFLPQNQQGILRPEVPTMGELKLNSTSASFNGFPPHIPGTYFPRMSTVNLKAAIIKPFERGQMIPNDGKSPIPGWFGKQNESNPWFIPDNWDIMSTGSGIIPGTWIPDITKFKPYPQRRMWRLKFNDQNHGNLEVNDLGPGGSQVQFVFEHGHEVVEGYLSSYPDVIFENRFIPKDPTQIVYNNDFGIRGKMVLIGINGKEQKGMIVPFRSYQIINSKPYSSFIQESIFKSVRGDKLIGPLLKNRNNAFYPSDLSVLTDGMESLQGVMFTPPLLIEAELEPERMFGKLVPEHPKGTSKIEAAYFKPYHSVIVEFRLELGQAFMGKLYITEEKSIFVPHSKGVVLPDAAKGTLIYTSGMKTTEKGSLQPLIPLLFEGAKVFVPSTEQRKTMGDTGLFYPTNPKYSNLKGKLEQIGQNLNFILTFPGSIAVDVDNIRGNFVFSNMKTGPWIGSLIRSKMNNNAFIFESDRIAIFIPQRGGIFIYGRVEKVTTTKSLFFAFTTSQIPQNFPPTEGKLSFVKNSISGRWQVEGTLRAENPQSKPGAGIFESSVEEVTGWSVKFWKVGSSKPILLSYWDQEDRQKLKPENPNEVSVNPMRGELMAKIHDRYDTKRTGFLFRDKDDPRVAYFMADDTVTSAVFYPAKSTLNPIFGQVVEATETEITFKAYDVESLPAIYPPTIGVMFIISSSSMTRVGTQYEGVLEGTDDGSKQGVGILRVMTFMAATFSPQDSSKPLSGKFLLEGGYQVFIPEIPHTFEGRTPGSLKISTGDDRRKENIWLGYLEPQKPPITPGALVFVIDAKSPLKRAIFYKDSGGFIEGYVKSDDVKIFLFLTMKPYLIPDGMPPMYGVLKSLDSADGMTKRGKLVPEVPRSQPGAGIFITVEEGHEAILTIEQQNMNIEGLLVQKGSRLTFVPKATLSELQKEFFGMITVLGEEFRVAVTSTTNEWILTPNYPEGFAIFSEAQGHEVITLIILKNDANKWFLKPIIADQVMPGDAAMFGDLKICHDGSIMETDMKVMSGFLMPQPNNGVILFAESEKTERGYLRIEGRDPIPGVIQYEGTSIIFAPDDMKQLPTGEFRGVFVSIDETQSFEVIMKSSIEHYTWIRIIQPKMSTSYRSATFVPLSLLQHPIIGRVPATTYQRTIVFMAFIASLIPKELPLVPGHLIIYDNGRLFRKFSGYLTSKSSHGMPGSSTFVMYQTADNSVKLVSKSGNEILMGSLQESNHALLFEPVQNSLLRINQVIECTITYLEKSFTAELRTFKDPVRGILVGEVIPDPSLELGIFYPSAGGPIIHGEVLSPASSRKIIFVPYIKFIVVQEVKMISGILYFVKTGERMKGYLQPDQSQSTDGRCIFVSILVISKDIARLDIPEGGYTTSFTKGSSFSVMEFEPGKIPEGALKAGSKPSFEGGSFVSTKKTKIFIPMFGVSGYFIINKGQPTDPQAIKVRGNFAPIKDSEFVARLVGDGVSPIHPALAAASGPVQVDGNFFPDGDLYAGISLSGIITIKRFSVTNNTAYIDFKAKNEYEFTIWTSEVDAGCFMYDEGGQLVPFDKEVIKEREKLLRAPRSKVPGSYYTGRKGVKVYLAADGSKGKIFYDSYSKLLDGVMYPKFRTQLGRFEPKDREKLEEILNENEGNLQVFFESDISFNFKESVVDNGVEGRLFREGTEYRFESNKFLQSGVLIPGRKAIPALYTFCVSVSSSPGGLGRSLDAGASIYGPKTETDTETEYFLLSDETVDFLGHPGWKTQDLPIQGNITLKFEDEIFYGLGTCRYDSPDISQFLDAQNADDLIRILSKVTRQDCLTLHTKRMLQLLSEELLMFQNGELVIVLEHPIVSLTKLNKMQQRKLEMAFEISVLSKVLLESAKNNGTAVSESIGETKCSRSVEFLWKYAMKTLSLIKAWFPSHYIVLSRNLIKTLNTAIIKLRHDAAKLKNCANCQFDLYLNKKDRVVLQALTKFITIGYSRFPDPLVSFKNYFENMSQYFESRLLV